MKKSEFDEELGKKANWRTENRHAGEWILIDRSDLHATLKKAGVQWDPEQPELPERLTLEKDTLGGLMIEKGSGRDEPWIDLSLVTNERPLDPEEVERLKELLARYNVVDSLNLHKADERNLFAAGVLRKWLNEEREKLR